MNLDEQILGRLGRGPATMEELTGSGPCSTLPIAALRALEKAGKVESSKVDGVLVYRVPSKACPAASNNQGEE